MSKIRQVVLIFLILNLTLLVPALSDDSQNEPYDSYGNPQYRYESFSGKKYQYDLSDPVDRLDYKIDLDAQMRDQLNPDPIIPMDRDMGQHGGGAEE